MFFIKKHRKYHLVTIGEYRRYQAENNFFFFLINYTLPGVQEQSSYFCLMTQVQTKIIMKTKVREIKIPEIAISNMVNT